MTKTELTLKKFDKILPQISEPEKLWTTKPEKGVIHNFYGYRSKRFLVYNKPICFGNFIEIRNEKEIDSVKKKSKIKEDIKMHLIYGQTDDKKDIEKDDIISPKIRITDEQFKKIRLLQ